MPGQFLTEVNSLAALVCETMGADPFSGAVYVLRAERADRIKLVRFGGTEEGKFCWPVVVDGVVRLTAAQLQGSWKGS